MEQAETEAKEDAQLGAHLDLTPRGSWKLCVSTSLTPDPCAAFADCVPSWLVLVGVLCVYCVCPELYQCQNMNKASLTRLDHCRLGMIFSCCGGAGSLGSKPRHSNIRHKQMRHLRGKTGGHRVIVSFYSEVTPQQPSPWLERT